MTKLTKCDKANAYCKIFVLFIRLAIVYTTYAIHSC
jgi:hypothetical protein